MKKLIAKVDAKLRSIDWIRWLNTFENLIAVLVAALFSALSRTHAFRKILVYVQSILPTLLHHPRLLASGLTALALMTGFGASYWKQKAQITYGVSEVAFGAVLSFNVLLSISSTFTPAKMLALGSAVYVIARGFNNIADANKKRVPIPA